MAGIRYSTGGGDGGGDFVPLPEGTYDFEIKGIRAGSASTGSPQQIVKLEVVDGEHAGKTHTEWCTMTPDAAWRFESIVKAAGVEPVDTGEVDSAGKAIREVDPEDLVGKFVRGTIVHRMYNGKLRANLAPKLEHSKFNAQAASDKPSSSPAEPAAQTQPASATQPAGAAPGAAALAPRRARPAPAQG